MNEYPKISVITVCFNAGEYIADNISSVNNQDYPNIEHIFIDGLSNDQTVSIIKMMTSSNYKLISERDNGIYNAMNKGIKEASGDYIIFLNSDDMFIDDVIISKYVQSINQSCPGIIFSDIFFTQRADKNRVTRRWTAGHYSKKNLKYGWMPPHPGVLLQRDIFETFGGFNEKFKISGDYDFLLRVFGAYRGNIHYLKAVSVVMREGGVSNHSFRNSFRKWKEDSIALRQNNVGSLLTVLLKRIRKIDQIF